MDDNQQTPVTDDQELANVLAGMNQQAAQAATSIDEGAAPEPEESADGIETPTLAYEPTADPAAPTADELPTVDTPALETPAVTPAEPELDIAPIAPVPVVEPSVAPLAAPSASPELDGIKKDALEQLRPLVDKLDLPADEKFDTLLLIIRSTDDKSLVNAAFDAAKGITDEGKRAQALLDVIKEIDYFTGHGEQPVA